jgi:hypothetical protein
VLTVLVMLLLIILRESLPSLIAVLLDTESVVSIVADPIFKYNKDAFLYNKENQKNKKTEP